MARLGRRFLPEQTLHMIQRGNNRQAVFLDADDAARYREWLAAAMADHGCALHAYALLPNHVHLLLTPRTADSLPRAMQSLGRRYVRYFNTRHGRSGTLWEGRYRAAPIDGAHLLACCRYIELNPVRAGLVRQPREHRWSSHRANADGADDPLLTAHAVQLALGATPSARCAAYRGLLATPLEPGFLAALRSATNGGWAMGDEAFQRRIAAALGRRVTPLPRGRPPKPKAAASSA